MRRFVAVTLLWSLMLAPVGVRGATAAADDRADAATIPWDRLPWWTIDTVEATVESGEDLSCLTGPPSAAPAVVLQSIWYEITPPADATIYVRSWAPGMLQKGLGLFEEGARAPIACGEDDGSRLLRVPIQGGASYNLQLSCACDPSSWVARGWQIEVGVVPENDEQDAAKAVHGLPYHDDVFLVATAEDPNSPDCGSLTAPVPIASVSTSQNVWYRFDASSDDTLLARTYRIPEGPSLNVYELRSDGELDALACSTAGSTNEYQPYRPFYETTLARFDVKAGHTYLVEVLEHSRYIEPVRFSLARANETDVFVEDLGISEPRAITKTLRTISVDINSTAGLGPNTYYILEVCPLPGSDDACTQLASGAAYDEILDEDLRHSYEWDTAGCVGDVKVRVTVHVPFAVDLDASDNVVERIVHLAEHPVGVGGGMCNLRGLTRYLYG